MKMQARNDVVSSVCDFCNKDNKDKFCVVIPVYNHVRTVAEVARQALKLNMPVFIVDDGSSDGTYVRVKNLS